MTEAPEYVLVAARSWAQFRDFLSSEHATPPSGASRRYGRIASCRTLEGYRGPVIWLDGWWFGFNLGEARDLGWCRKVRAARGQTDIEVNLNG